MTALSSTTLSGYVDTSAQWNFGSGDVNLPPYAFGGGSKADGFNLDVVDLALDHPEDESPWASGYHVELWMGPDAASLGTTLDTGGNSDSIAIQQAYVTLRTPVGNGIDWKLGVFNTIIGYESFNSPLNPNYTRSYGFTIEPGQHTGLLGTYIVNSELTVSAGIANTLASSAINNRAFQTGNPVTSGNMVESYKTYMGAATYTVSTNAGWLSGSTFSAGIVNGFNSTTPNPSVVVGTPAGVGVKQTSAYAGTTLNTPVTNLKIGASMDFLYHHGGFDNVVAPGDNGRTWAWDLYGSYQATEKLALNLRGELVNNSSTVFGGAGSPFNNNRLYEVTATASYSLWKNVISRAEFRWDHINTGSAFGGTVNGAPPDLSNAFLLAANIIYQF
jgi:hypothetical protein